jgi:hypothetical protein
MQEFETDLPEDNYTLTVKVLSVTDVCDVKLENSSGVQVEKTIDSAGVITASFYGPVNAVTFELNGTDSQLSIEWVKLEVGTVSTPFVPKSYYEEVALCTKYYRSFQGVIGCISVLDTNCAFLPIELGGMRTSPTIGYTENTMKLNIKGVDYTVAGVTSNKNSTGGVVLLSLTVAGLTTACAGCAGVALMNNDGITDVAAYNRLTLDSEVY